MNKLNSLIKVAMVATGIAAFAAQALAATVNNVKYIDASGQEQTCTEATVVAASGSRVAWNAGWYAVTNEVTISGGADCSGAVHLILADTGKLTISDVANNNAGIGVTGNPNTLAIYGQSAGTGALNVTGGGNGAGIGGGNKGAGKNITINGGTVTANGGQYGAGIGGGYVGKGQNITINGGKVKATGGETSAAIGGGTWSTGQDITFNGGEVTAIGGGGAAAIGGSEQYRGLNIRFTGGTVTATATAGEYGSGSAIGSGFASDFASTVYAEEDVLIKANGTEIAHSGVQDIASAFAGKMSAYSEPMPKVTVVVPEVAGATAQVYAFKGNGGWRSVAADEVWSNATVRVVWTADADKGLTGAGAANAYQWQAAFGPVVGGEIAPAPTVGEAGASEVSLDLDTRAKKSYFDAKDILPIWYAAGAEAKVKGEGEQSWTVLVKSSATTNTLNWTPTEPDTYTLSQTPLANTTIIYTLPVEVTTNDLEVAGATAVVTDDGGQPLVAQTEGELAGKLIVPSNSVITVTWTATEKGTYFADGSTTYVQKFKAGQSVNPASESVEAPKAPAAPNAKLGVVAQRYPWDGKLDVHYWAKNTPNKGYLLKVTVTLPDGTAKSQESDALNGKNTAVFDAKEAFGEVKLTGVKVKAELVDAPPPN